MKQGDLFGGSSLPAKEPPKPRVDPVPEKTLSLPLGQVQERAPEAQPPAPVRAEPAPRPESAPRAVEPAPAKSSAPPKAEADVPAWRKPAPAKRVLTVSELTYQLKEAIEPKFTRVIVRGEVTGFRGANARGHLYFAIKDETAQIDVRIWQTQAKQLKFQIRDGLSLIVEGGLNVYEVQGRYSIIAQKVEPEGVGAMALAFEQLKAKLVKEGLIGEGRTKPRRPLPVLPKRIGVVTSSSGAAWRDFLKVLHRRHPGVSVLFCNARVQGEEAPIEVARGLRWLAKTDVDVIVVTRGGGSVEDLWTFNEERVVRAIFNSPIPVVSAVGHEVDITLSDLVADYRAPTPSAAAEAVVPEVAELRHRMMMTRRRLVTAMERRLLQSRNRLQQRKAALGDPRRQLTSRRLTLSELGDRIRRASDRAVRLRKRKLEEIEARLTRVRPQTRLVERRTAFTALSGKVRSSLQRRMRAERARLSALRLSLERSSPRPRVRDGRRRLENVQTRLPAAIRRRLDEERRALESLSARLDALSPLKVLGRGYAIVAREGAVVRRSADVAVGDQLTVRLDQGDSLSVRVEGRAAGKDEE
ncbi:MAG: exodeoxyribonuclease VII large subunit [Archangiaceae bacterium]|nr:exodeoxyribonuclease VII large subunit [Archangiaceae bacterium]